MNKLWQLNTAPPPHLKISVRRLSSYVEFFEWCLDEITNPTYLTWACGPWCKVKVMFKIFSGGNEDLFTPKFGNCDKKKEK